jgi:crotonobetainyl-CoA:carnitine CoA-transferase CaiB-like acyl-CoA transferase
MGPGTDQLTQKSAAEWSALFNAHGVPAGEVLDVPSVLTHPQVTSRALVKTFEEARRRKYVTKCSWS